MAAKCSKCGAEIADDWTVCRSCFESVKREGLLARLKRFLGSGRASPNSMSVNITQNELIKIRDPFTGNLLEYRSLDEVPAELRGQIRKLREQALAGGGAGTITITDSSGKVSTYHSVEELPPEMRQLYDKALRQTQTPPVS